MGISDSPLPGVPEEVVLQILDQLLISEMASVARVSRDFWRITAPLLWKDLEEIEGNRHIQSLLLMGRSSNTKVITAPGLEEITY